MTGRLGTKSWRCNKGLLCPVFSLRNAPFGEAEKADIEVVQVEFLDLPLLDQSLFIGFNEAMLFFGTHTSKCVIGWITENDEDGGVALDVLGSVAFFFEFTKEELLLWALWGLPACKSVSEEDTDTFITLLGERGPEVLEEEAELEVSNDERSWKDFKTEDVVFGGLLEVCGDKGVVALLFECFVDMLQDFHNVGAGAATRVEDINVLVRKPIGKIEFFAEYRIDARDHVLDDLGWRVPNTELLAKLWVEGLKERFVKILYGVAFLKFGEKDAAIHAIEGRASVVKYFGETKLFKLARIGNFME